MTDFHKNNSESFKKIIADDYDFLEYELEKIKSARDFILFLELYPNMRNLLAVDDEEVYIIVKNFLNKLNLKYSNCPKNAINMNVLLDICDRFDVNANFPQILFDAAVDENFDVCHELFKFGVYIRPDLNSHNQYYSKILSEEIKNPKNLLTFYNMNALTIFDAYNTPFGKLMYNTICYFLNKDDVDTDECCVKFSRMLLENIESTDEEDVKKRNDVFGLISYMFKFKESENIYKIITSSIENATTKNMFSKVKTYILDDLEKIYNLEAKDALLKIPHQQQEIISFPYIHNLNNSIPLKNNKKEDLEKNNLPYFVVSFKDGKLYFYFKSTISKNSSLIDGKNKIINLDTNRSSENNYLVSWVVYLLAEQDFDSFLKNFCFSLYEDFIKLMKKLSSIDFFALFEENVLDNLHKISEENIHNDYNKNVFVREKIYQGSFNYPIAKNL